MGNSLSFIVRVLGGMDEEQTPFLGTGIAITSDRVLTCKHVVQERDPQDDSCDVIHRHLVVQNRTSTRLASVGRVVCHPELDLALLKLDSTIVQETAVFLAGIGRDHEQTLFSQDWLVSGYRAIDEGRDPRDHPHVAPMRPEYDSLSGLLTDVQLTGGLPVGFSGSPVLIEIAEGWVCIGLAYLGGEKSGTSRMIAADSLLAFLRKEKVDSLATLNASSDLLPSVASADNFRRWLLEHPRHGKLEILGRPIANWELYQELLLLQEIDQEKLPLEEGTAESFEQDRHALRLDRWEEDVLRERRSCAPPVAMDRLLEDFEGVVQSKYKQHRTLVSTVPRFVVLGPPGSGKSTLCQWLQWRGAEGRLARHGRQLLPAYVRLVDWKADKLSEFLAGQFHIEDGPSPDQWHRWLDGGEVLLLLDGLDEVEAQSPVLDKVRGVLNAYQRCPALLTCRTVSRERHQEVCPHLPVFLLAGLEKPQRDAYIEHLPGRHCDHKVLIEQLDRTPAMQPLAASPLLLAIICYVFEDGLKLPATRGDLYEAAVTRLLKRPLRDPAHKSGLALAQRRQILQRAAFRLFLAKGAQRQLTFDEKELLEALVAAVHAVREEDHAHEVADRLRVDLLDRGVLTGHDERSFAFLHPTIQEFLTASEIARRVEDSCEAWDTMITVGDKQCTIRRLVSAKAWAWNWKEVIVLLAGRLTDPEPLLEMLSDPRPTRTNPDGDDHFRHRLGLAALCLPELPRNRRTSCDGIAERITTDAFGLWLEHKAQKTAIAVEHLTDALPALAQVNGNYRGQPLLDWVCATLPEAKAFWVMEQIGSLRATAKILARLAELLSDSEAYGRHAALVGVSGLGAVVTPEILARLAELLSDSGRWERDAAALVVGRLGTVAATPEILARLAEMLSDPEGSVRSVAALAVDGLGAVAATPEILARLAELFGDPERKVRHAALMTVRKLGAAAATPEFLARLAEMLGAPDVRDAAPKAVSELKAVAATPEILARLVDLLSDSKGYVRYVATEAVDWLGAVVATPEILARLAELLNDREGGARSAAAWVVGRLGAVAATPEILARLAELLSDPEGNVRCAALATVGRLGAVVATPEILARLAEMLSDPEGSVRSVAALAVDGLGAVAATPEILARLAELFGDPERSVRSAAAEAVGRLGAMAAAPEILARLAEMLGAPEGGVRSAVAEAVGRLGAMAATPEILARLAEMLGAPEGGVRSAAAEAVGRLGAMAATPEILARLAEMLGAPEGGVRSAAVEAVGRLGAVAATPEILARLAELFGDPEGSVRCAALATVGRLGAVAATPEILVELLQSLEYTPSIYRHGASIAIEILTAQKLRVFKRRGLWQFSISLLFGKRRSWRFRSLDDLTAH